MLVSPLVVGIEGKKAGQALVDRLKKINPAGILLLARNIDSPRQVASLTRDINEAMGRSLLWTIDHEGGNVVRFSKGMTSFPSAQAIGKTGNPDLAYAVGRQMALELSALGIAVDFAPVLDLGGSSYNPGIGTRSFGDDHRQVAIFGKNFIRGLQDHHVWACAKHFPGMGDARLDPHVLIPQIDASRAAILNRHVVPFLAAFKAGVKFVMTSHIRYPALDLELATFSKKIVTGLLREKLGFRGVVISDDLSMGAVLKSGLSPANAAVKALKAGHDLLILSDPNFTLQNQVKEAVASLANDKKSAPILNQRKIHRPRMTASASLTPSPKRDADARPSALTAPLHSKHLASWIAGRAIRVLRPGSWDFPLDPKKNSILVLFPQLLEIKSSFAFEEGPEGPARWLKKKLKSKGLVRFVETPVKEKQVGFLRRAVQEADQVLFFCFEARRFPGQKAVLNVLNKMAADKTAVFLMRGSADLPLIDPGLAVIDMAGDRKSQMEAALKVILK